MQQMQRRAAGISGGGGRVLRNENGLTPYQQAQMDYKKAKDEAKAAEAEAKKNVMLGLDPVSKEPIVYRNESGQSLTQKDRDRLLADELQRRLKNAAGQDVELNKALGELNSGTELSTQRRSELQRVVRDRTKALGREYGIDDRATFDAIIGPSKQVLDEQRQALRNDSFLDTVWAGMRKGGNALYYAATMPFMSDAERLEAAEQMRKEQEAITRSSPTLQERALVEAEAAREGKDVGYMQAAQANLASNIGASVADTVTSFAPAIAAGMIPVVGTYAAPLLAGGIGAGLNQVSQAARVEADPNLTEAQKQQALSYSDPGFVATTGVGGVTGLLMPGGVGSGIVRGAGNAAFRRAAAAGPINPANVSGITGRALRAGAKATERANAPRSLAALGRDVPVNMAENAGLMAANTVGANVAYNMSTGQPLTQDAMEGVGRAAMEGAIVGVPFGIGRTIRRQRAPEAPVAERSAATTTETQPNIENVVTIQNRPASEWRKELNTAVNKTKVDEAGANKLIAEYLSTGTEAPETLHSRLNDLQNIPVGKGLTPRGKKALTNLLKKWEGAETDGTITEKINGLYQPAGESRLTANMGESERAGTERPAGQDSGNDSQVATNPPAGSSDVASGSAVPDNAGGAETSGGGNGRPAAQNSGQAQTPSAASPQAGREGTPASQQPANAGSTGAGGKSSGNGAGESTPSTVGGNGSTGNAATPSGGEQPVSWRVIPPDHADAITANNKARETFENTTLGTKYVRIGNEWYKVEKKTDKNGKEVTRRSKADSTTRRILNSVSREAAKSTNPKGEVKESRFLPRQQYSSAGTSRNQIPESFKKIPWATGTRNLDIGAGAFELGTDYLRSRGVENTPFDPYNRATDANNAALDTLRNGEKYDTVTVANLLNVVQEPEIRDNIIKQAAHSVKPDGKAYFQVYESDRSGVGRQTRTGGTDDNWQNARTLKSYQPDIERHFGKVESKDGMLIASEPKDPGPVEWQLNRDGDTVREQHRIAVSSHSPYIISYAGKQWIEKRDADNPRIRHYYANDGQVADEATAYALDKLAYRRNVEEVKTELSHQIEVEERNIENAEHELRQLDKYGPDPYDDEALSRDELVAYLKKEQNFLARYKGALRFLEQSDEVHVLHNQSRAEAVASNKLPDNLRRLFTTREEKQILADLDSSDIDATYVENTNRALRVILGKLPGLKTKEANIYLEYGGANAIYDPINHVIGVNLYDSAGSSSEILQRMNHEIGHGTQREIGNPSTNTFINTEVYRDASPAMRADVEDAYSRYRSEDFYGEEVYSEIASGELPFVDAESARAGILELYDSVPSDKKTRLYSQAMSFFAQYADQGMYSTFVKNAILNSDAHRNMFLHGDTSSIENGLARGLVQDYQNLTDIAGVPRNKETLGLYLDELLDPTTELNVFKRQSVVC